MNVLRTLFMVVLILVLSSAALPGQEKADSTADITANLVTSVKEAQPEWTFSFGKIIWSLIVLCAAYVAIRYISQFLGALAERWTKARLTIKGFIPITRVLGWTLALYVVIVEVLSPPIGTVLAVTASAGIAIGFAAQDILKNIFGGITILFDRPFQAGDKIEVGNHYGEVLSIGLRTVRVVTADDSTVSIPNSEIVNQSVSNANSGRPYCQVVAEFFLPADIDLVKVREVACEAAVVSRYLYLNKPVRVIFRNEVHEGRSLIKMRLKAYVLDHRFEFPFASEMTETVLRELLSRNLVQAEELSMLLPAAATGPVRGRTE